MLELMDADTALYEGIHLHMHVVNVFSSIYQLFNAYNCKLRQL